MSRNEEKKKARIFSKYKFKPVESPFEKFAQPWYLDWWLPKSIFVIGFLCILWKAFDIFVLERFP